MDRSLNVTEAVRPGDRATVTLTAGLNAWQDTDGQNVIPFHTVSGRAFRRAATITRPALEFVPGDVVVLRMNPASAQEFTYVRGQSRFLGEVTNGPSDDSVRDLFAADRGRLIARHGIAVPVPITRHNTHLLASLLPF